MSKNKFSYLTTYPIILTFFKFGEYVFYLTSPLWIIFVKELLVVVFCSLKSLFVFLFVVHIIYTFVLLITHNKY